MNTMRSSAFKASNLQQGQGHIHPLPSILLYDAPCRQHGVCRALPSRVCWPCQPLWLQYALVSRLVLDGVFTSYSVKFFICPHGAVDLLGGRWPGVGMGLWLQWGWESAGQGASGCLGGSGKLSTPSQTCAGSHVLTLHPVDSLPTSLLKPPRLGTPSTPSARWAGGLHSRSRATL